MSTTAPLRGATVQEPTPTTWRGRPAVAASAAVYVGAWVAGLLVPGASLPSDPTAEEVRAVYVDHAAAVVAQASLVHAIAGAALAVLALGLASAAVPERLRRGIAATGLAAAAVSAVQVLLAVAGVAGAAGRPAAWSLDVRQAIDLADVVKLLLLAAFVALVTRAAGPAARPRWPAVVGRALSALLVLGALSFVLAAPLLAVPLAASLVLLLVWVGAQGVVAARR